MSRHRQRRPPEEDGAEPDLACLPSFTAHLNLQRVRVDKIMSIYLLATWAPAFARASTRCSPWDLFLSASWAALLALCLAWGHFRPRSYSRCREPLLAVLRTTRWAVGCVSQPTTYISLRPAEGAAGGRRPHDVASVLAFILVVPALQLQGALGFPLRLPWAALLQGAEVALTLPSMCRLCTGPAMAPGAPVVHALHRALCWTLAPWAAASMATTTTSSSSSPLGGSGSSSPGGGGPEECQAVSVFLYLSVGFALPLLVHSMREQAAFWSFYQHYHGNFSCDGCSALYLADRGYSGAGGGRAGWRWRRWAVRGVGGYLLLCLLWDVVAGLAAARGASPVQDALASQCTW